MLMSNQHHALYYLHDYYCFVVYCYKRSCFVGMKSKINVSVLKSYQQKLSLGIGILLFVNLSFILLVPL